MAENGCVFLQMFGTVPATVLSEKMFFVENTHQSTFKHKKCLKRPQMAKHGVKTSLLMQESNLLLFHALGILLIGLFKQ